MVNEALYCGCPVVVSDRCGCVPELVQDGITGFTVTCGDVVDLRDKMLLVHSTMSDIEAVAKKCQQCISIYTPQNAAKHIVENGILLQMHNEDA